MQSIGNPDYKAQAYQQRQMAKRRRAETRFRAYGIIALLLAGGMLSALMFSIFYNGLQGLVKDVITVEVTFDEKKIDPRGLLASAQTDEERQVALKQIRLFNFDTLVYPELYEVLDIKPKGRSAREARRKVKQLVGLGASNQLRTMVVKQIGTKPDGTAILEQGEVTLGDRLQVTIAALSTASNPYTDQLREKDIVSAKFNFIFFTGTNSNDPGYYGILGALVGSFWTILICFLASFPIAILAAVYLEEFAPRNRITDFIEININNLAAVPSIIFGLMGAYIFISVFKLTPGTALVGGLVLSLLTLPTIIVAARAAIRSVPGSFREAALGLGASKQQAMFHFVLPYAMPGIITGTIIGLAGALGETAPLLLIGMVGFIDGIPALPTSPTPSLPVSVFNLFGAQFDEMQRQLSNSTIIVLLSLLVLMNGSAALIRYYAERRN